MSFIYLYEKVISHESYMKTEICLDIYSTYATQLLIRQSKYSAILSKIHSHRLLLSGILPIGYIHGILVSSPATGYHTMYVEYE